MGFQPWEHVGPTFIYGFENVTLSTNATDLFCVTASTNSRVVIRHIELGQFSEFGNAQSELLSLRLLTGSTQIGGGTVITGRNIQRHSGAPTAGSSVTGPST